MSVQTMMREQVERTMLPRYIRRAELAVCLGVTPKRISDMALSGVLPKPVRLPGGSPAWPEHQIRELLEKLPEYDFTK